jgi:hypothetical protein
MELVHTTSFVHAHKSRPKNLGTNTIYVKIGPNFISNIEGIPPTWPPTIHLKKNFLLTLMLVILKFLSSCVSLKSQHC